MSRAEFRHRVSDLLDSGRKVTDMEPPELEPGSKQQLCLDKGYDSETPTGASASTYR